MVEVKEGMSPRLEGNNWFNESIKPKAIVMKYVAGEDGFHYQLALVRKAGGLKSIVIAKVAKSGFMKTVISFDEDVAGVIADAIKEML